MFGLGVQVFGLGFGIQGLYHVSSGLDNITGKPNFKVVLYFVL